MKTITVFTSTRAEYHLLYSVIKRIYEDPMLNLDLVVSGTHLSKKFGYTITQIEADGFPIGEKIETISENSENDVDCIISKTLVACSNHFKRVKSDFLIILGDRYEILGPVIAASNALIPIAHIHGGETTEGAIDEAVRHAVTKFSYLHFPSCEPYRNRIIQLGEAPNRVFNVGSLGVENILNQKKMEKEELQDNLCFELKKYCLVTFHPVTLEKESSELQIHELLSALDSFEEYKYIITKANADNGGELINSIIEKHVRCNPDKYLLVDSLGMIRYHSAMKYCEMVIGNSSSGLLEAPTFSIPTINIGDRQKGRISAGSVINCKPNKESIADAMKKASTIEFKNSIQNMPQIYGDGTASKKIISIIKDVLSRGIELKKQFYDIEVK